MYIGEDMEVHPAYQVDIIEFSNVGPKLLGHSLGTAQPHVMYFR